eukprot:GEMP01005215.1.p1 GENE.GEMP01005215.1~~GEMP01005215.1.p1  ORF type:complete len:936 (+),score=150.46 GEMP01005215.1:140-2947(+)
MKNQVVLAFFACAAASVSEVALKAAEDAKLKAVSNCKTLNGMSLDVADADDQQARKKVLEFSAGDPNHFDDLIQSSKGSGKLWDSAIQKLRKSPISLLSEALGLILAIIAFSVFFLFCFQVCPCFSCCRCFKKERNESRRATKFVAFVTFFLVAVGMLIAGIVAASGQSAVRDGINRAACSASQFANSTLNGHVGNEESSDFTGFLPAINRIDTFTALLSPDSTFVTTVKNSVAKTKPIDDAVKQLSQALDVAGKVVNVAPTVFGGDKYPYHSCLLCNAIAGPLQQTDGILEGSLQEKLVAVRQEVEDNLTKEKLNQLKSNFDEVLTLLLNTTDLLAKGLQPALDINYVDIRSNYNTISLLIVLSVVFVALAILVLAMVSIWLFIKNQIRAGASSSESNPYSRCLPTTACWSCATSCIFSIVILIIAGIVAALIKIPAGGCLVFDDMNGQQLKEIGDAVGYKDIDQQKIDLWDTCFTNTGNGKVLEVIPACQENCSANDVDQTVASKLDETLKTLDSSFDTVNVTDIPVVAENPKILTLMKILALPIGSLVMLDQEALKKNGSLMMIVTDPRGTSNFLAGMQVGLLAGLECNDAKIDTTASDELNAKLSAHDERLNDTIPGINQFINKLDTFSYAMYQNPEATGNASPSSVTCPTLNKVTCPDSDAAKLTNIVELQGLRNMMVACKNLADTNPPTGFDKPTFDSNMSTFLAEIAKKIGKSTVDETALTLAQNYLMNREDKDQSAGRMTCDICTAGNNFIVLKKSIIDSTALSCFSVEDNTESDTATCDASSGTNCPFDVKETSCNVQGWVDSTATVTAHLRDSITNLDDQTAAFATEIKDDLTGLVSGSFITPAKSLIADMNCQYLNVAKRDVVDGICYGAIYGLLFIVNSYVAVGVLAFILGVMSFLVWRHSHDNRSEWDALNNRTGPPPQFAV